MWLIVLVDKDDEISYDNKHYKGMYVIVNVWLHVKHWIYTHELAVYFYNETGSECGQIQCYMRSHMLIVLLLLVRSPTSVSVLIVYIRCALQSSSPSGRACSNAGTTVLLCAMTFIHGCHPTRP